jgi:dihydropyrimidinase
VSILIAGGRVVTAEGSFDGDVLIEDGRVASVGRHVPRAADSVLDATGMLVMPGAVDVHTHLDAPNNEITAVPDDEFTCDDYRHGSIAAAVGGTTTLIDFATQFPGVGLRATFDEWQAKLAERPLAIDIGLHMIVSDLSVPNAEAELAALCDDGMPSYKLFMAYKESPLMVDDDTLFRVAQVAARAGAVVVVHAESGDPINVLQRQAVAAGNLSAAWHARTRPPATEAEAVNRVIELCRVAGAPVYIMHVSCAEALAVIERAQQAGLPVRAETCTHYLYVDESWLERCPDEACKYVFTPPPRTRNDREALWDGLRRGVLSVVSTDHCPYTLKQKRRGAHSFMATPNGVPGVENRLEVMYELGVRGGRLDASALVRILSTAPAQLYGMYPQKGSLAPGSDGDVVVFDPARPRTLSAANQISHSDFSVYEGMAVAGSVSAVVMRGEVIVENGRPTAAAGRGRFLPRARSLDAFGIGRPGRSPR